MLKTVIVLVALVTGGSLVHVDVEARPASSTPVAEEFKVDAGHSAVLFRIAHLDTAPFWGRFNKVEGNFKLGAGEGDFVNVKVDAASVDTNDEKRDRHVMSQDFFSVKEFPSVEFKSKSVKFEAEEEATIVGDLTFHGVTKSVTFTARHTGTREVGGRFGKRTGWEAELTVKRSDFNMKYGLEQRMLGDEIRLLIALEGVK